MPKGGLRRGRKRIRTAVKGFADPCLAARPSDLFRECKYSNNNIFFTGHPKITIKLLKAILGGFTRRVSHQYTWPQFLF